MKHNRQDVTGVGATACASHGAFAPGAVVNFDRGERYRADIDAAGCILIILLIGKSIWTIRSVMPLQIRTLVISRH